MRLFSRKSIKNISKPIKGMIIGVALLLILIIWFLFNPIVTEERVEREIEAIKEEISAVEEEGWRKLEEGEAYNGDYFIYYSERLNELEKEAREISQAVEEGDASLESAWEEIKRINREVSEIRRAVEVWN